MSLPNAIEVVTLFVDDVTDAKAFYRRVFEPEVVYEDEVSCVLKFEGAMVNLLDASQAPQLVQPVPVAPAGSGARILLTIKVADVDAVCATLQRPRRDAAQRSRRPAMGTPHRRVRRPVRPCLGNRPGTDLTTATAEESRIVDWVKSRTCTAAGGAALRPPKLSQGIPHRSVGNVDQPDIRVCHVDDQEDGSRHR